MDRRSANRRTWRNKPSQLTNRRHGDTKRRTWRSQLAQLFVSRMGDSAELCGAKRRNAEAAGEAFHVLLHGGTHGVIWCEATHDILFVSRP